MSLTDDLREVLNRSSRESASETPDFLLAEYMLRSLEAFEVTVRSRDRWYGIAPYPGWRAGELSQTPAQDDAAVKTWQSSGGSSG